MTVPRALLLVLALLQAVGITDVMRRVACEEECRRDGCDDQGPCSGDACACHCPAARSVAAIAPVAIDAPPRAPASSIVFAAPRAGRASPDPREILHVPRRDA